MRIKKTFQGSLPENTVVNTQSNSQVNAYSCNYLNNKIISESGNDYIRYSDGTQICWGNSTGVDGGVRTVTFPKPFKTNTTPNVIANSQQNSANYVIHCQVGTISNTDFGCRIFYQSSSGGGWGVGGNAFHYVAFGKWK